MSMSVPSFEEGAIGKWVVLPFEMEDSEEHQPFVGQIRRMKKVERTEVSCGPGGRSAKRVRVNVEHLVAFQDGEERWYDLKTEDEEGRLTWVKALPRRDPKPTRTNKPKGKKIPARTKDAEKSDFIVPQWIDEMRAWLIRRPMKPDSARTIIKQVKKLASGAGVTYHHWPKDVVFAQGISIDMRTDFQKLLSEAKKFEAEYGRDKGNGWLLTIPLGRLHQFQQFHRMRASSNAAERLMNDENVDHDQDAMDSRPSAVANARQGRHSNRGDNVRFLGRQHELPEAAIASAPMDISPSPMPVDSAATVEAEASWRPQQQARRPQIARACKTSVEPPVESGPSDRRGCAGSTSKTNVSQKQKQQEGQNSPDVPCPLWGSTWSNVKTGGLPGSEDICSLAPWLHDMFGWLLTFVKKNSARQVMNQVEKLAAGHGVAFKTWPDDVVFYRGVKVDLSFDIEKMLIEAKEFEGLYGKDKSGWFLKYPLRNLQKFQDHQTRLSI